MSLVHNIFFLEYQYYVFSDLTILDCYISNFFAMEYTETFRVSVGEDDLMEIETFQILIGLLFFDSTKADRMVKLAPE